MRVALVSAHYPPNFVSGGTLVPQRMARGLVKSGHEVFVFAGRLDDSESPLTEFTERDEHGISVTWVNTTPWTSWADRRNHDNPEVAEVFGRWLDEIEPDVVNLHALQTLGGSLVSEAARRGCATAVTMHDYWWFCARQFLVDPDGRPCSLVVDAGVCPCQAGREALAVRTATLAPHLAAADLVLAPSATTAQVLRANGVPASRVRLNGNGMDTAASTCPRTESAVVRFRYTGGAEDLKGATVLRRAIERLPSSPSWRMTIHCREGDTGFAPLVGNSSVELAAPYHPDELDEVLARTDVLVLPSLARETFSIATREALLRGVPVITSDSLGPEEVIVDGVNGLVVPTGDDAALAEAMRSVIADRAVLDRLRAGSLDLEVRSVDDQVDELERLLTEAVATAASPPARPWTPRRVTFVVGIDGAPLRYRAQYPAEALQMHGVRADVLHYNDPRVEGAVRASDAVVLYRVPATPRLVAIADGARASGTPVVFDVDDLIVDPGIVDGIPALRTLPPDELELWLEGVRRYRTTLEHCDAYIGSTQPLVEHIGALTGLPAHLKHNAYGITVAQLSDAARLRPRDPGPVRVGYFSGTKTHDADLAAVTPALVKLLEERRVELWLGGLLPPVAALDCFGERVRRIPLRPWYELPELLRQVDVNIAPLADLGTFNQAKSAIKWLEAALVQTPTIATATRPFASAISDGVTGVLVDGPAGWERALLQLVDDDTARRRIGAAAHRSALLDWSPHLQADRYLEILRQVRSSPRPPRSSSWADVTVEEAPAGGPVPLTPYPAGPTGPEPPAASGRAARLWRSAWWSFNNEPLPVVGRRVGGRVRSVVRRISDRAGAAARARRHR